MVSENNNSDYSKSNEISEKHKDSAKKSLKEEIKSLLTQKASWSKEPTQFDHLPPHEKPFPIEPFPNERQRLPFKMSDEDRQRRKIWVQSQSLTEREPVRVPELETMLYNPIRRLYRTPTDKIFKMLGPLVGEQRVPFFRYTIPKVFMMYLAGCVVWYNIKYNASTWEEKKGITTIKTNGIFLPDEEKPPQFKKWDYADYGFQNRKAFKGPEYAY